MKILVVEDDDRSRAILVEGLSGADEVLDAENGESAVQIIEQGNVDLVITDLVMPTLSGLDVLEAAKNKRPTTEVIVVTGHASMETAIKAMRRGARDYIEKPLNMELLLAKVENIRDYTRRLKEIEDYRFAKDIFEANAARSLLEMEKFLAENKQSLEKIKSIIDKNDINAEDKVTSIAKIIAEST